MQTALVLNKKDNVATTLINLDKNMKVDIIIGDLHIKIKIIENIPMGHKFLIKNIRKGENIIKYGEIIGRSTKFIKVGSHVHIHNVESLRGRGDLSN
ncbi:Galactarate dehydratase (L-threo-forming) [subsurface metagenome]